MPSALRTIENKEAFEHMGERIAQIAAEHELGHLGETFKQSLLVLAERFKPSDIDESNANCAACKGDPYKCAATPSRHCEGQ
jgi:hypothetical protein